MSNRTGPDSAPNVSPESNAVDWFLRRQEDGLDGPSRAAFEAWLSADPNHAAAYARVEAVWAAPAFVEALEGHGRGKSGRSLSMGMVMRMAASIALLTLIGAGALRLAGIPLRLPSDYATHVGDLETARLTDGTKLVLDSDTAVDLAYSRDERHIELRDGRAYFDVGQDRRPFRVTVNGIAIRDIGTRFSVERDGDLVRVAVQDGEVALFAHGGKESGQHLRVGQVGGYDHGYIPVRAVPIDISFAWLDHRLFFEQAPLGQVVEQLRRYHRGWIVIADAKLATIRISGGYDTRDVSAAAEDIARLSGASLIRVSDRLLILR